MVDTYVWKELIMAGPEKVVEDKIKEYLESKSYWYMKVWGGSGVKKGVPDIITVINGYFVSFEVKRGDGKGRITPVQKKNAEQIKDNNGTAVFISCLDTLKIVEAYLLNNKSVKNLNLSEDDLCVLHLNDIAQSVYDKGLYEGIWI